MRCAFGVCVFVLCGSFTTAAQVFPTSGGGCGVMATGVVSCELAGGVPKDVRTDKQGVSGGRPTLEVIRVSISAGALLPHLYPDQDLLVIGIEKGEFVNEAKSPALHVPIDEHSVFILPKEEPDKLRNVGGEKVDVFVVPLRSTCVAPQ
jgi:hypothetical protein